jgi:hypothetical protein
MAAVCAGLVLSCIPQSPFLTSITFPFQIAAMGMQVASAVVLACLISVFAPFFLRICTYSGTAWQGRVRAMMCFSLHHRSQPKLQVAQATRGRLFLHRRGRGTSRKSYPRRYILM